MSNLRDSFKKEHKKIFIFCFVIASLFLFAQNVHATLYAPGVTLEPDCPPTDSLSTCGIATSTGAASGANSDITSLSGLTTALAPSEGGTGLSLYNPGDILYALSPGTLANLGIGTSGQVLTVSASGTPVWNTGSSPDIGNSDLTLSGNRTLSFNGNSLDFHGTLGDINFDNTGDISASGNLTVAGTSTLPGPFVTTKTPDYVTTGTQNNVYFGYGSVTDYAGSAPATFTGMAAGVDGEQKRVSNHSTSNIFFTDQDANSVAADRIITSTGGTLTVPPNVSIDFQYDGPAAKWQVTELTATAVTIAGYAYEQGGNAFGAPATLGTTDANPLSFITAGANRFTIATTSATLTGTGATLLTSNNTLSLTSAAASDLDITSGTTGNLNLDSGTTGNISIGSSTNAKTITIGNGTGGTAININSGTGGINLVGLVTLGNVSATNLTAANAISVDGLSTTTNGIVNTQTKYQITGNDVLTSNTLGSGILNSSLTSLGTLGALNVSGTSTLATTSISRLSLGNGLVNNFLAVDASGNVIATSTANLLSNYVTFAYASSTYASTTYVNNTFPTFTYASSTFLSLAQAASNYVSTSTLTNNYVPYTYASSTFEVLSDKSTSTTLGTSDILYPTQNAVKTYVDNVATGLIWQNPVQVINVIGDASAPIASPNNDDAYIINTGGNTGAWSSFAAGDLVQYQSPSWVKIKSLAIGDYMGIDFSSTSTPSGSMTGKKNYIVEITGGSAGAFTYTFAAPVNNYAVFVSNTNAFYHDVSFTYSSSLSEWVQLSASANFTFMSGLTTFGTQVSLGPLTSDWNQTGVFNIDTAGKIGIGTTTPATALSIIGTSTTQALNISNLANSFLAVDTKGNVIATSTANLLSNYITSAYASSTYASTTYVNNTFLPLSASTSLAYIPFASSTLYYLNTNPAGYVTATTSTLTNYVSTSTFTTTLLGYLSTTSAAAAYLPLSASTSLAYIPFASSSLYVPYTGANANVNLGSNTFTVSGQTTLGSASTTNISISGNFLIPEGADYMTTGSQNNVNLGTGSWFIYNGNGPATFTGFSGGIDGKVFYLLNDSNFTLTITDTDSSSTAANRVETPTGSSIILTTDNIAEFIYNTQSSTWHVASLPANQQNISSYAFEQSGNAFGAPATLGTTDANPLSFITAGANRFTIATTSATLTGTGATLLTSNNTLSLTSAAASDLDITSGTTGNLNLDSGTTGNISIGSSTNAKTITIGNGTGGTSLVLNAGTGNIEIGTNAVARTINLGNAAASVETINIGGTGANVIGIGNAQVGGSIAIGGALTTGTIDIGNSNGAMTGTINVGGSTGAQILNFGGGSTGIKTINIGNGTAGNTISVGNGANTSVQVLNIAAGASAANSTVNILSGVATAGLQTLNLGTGASAKTINIGNQTGTSTVTVDSGTGNIAIGTGAQARTIDIGNGAATQTIVIGSTNGASALTLDSGTGAMNIGINIAKTITLGNTTGATSLALDSGTGGLTLLTGTTGNVLITSGTTGSVTLDSGTTGTVNLGTGNNAKTINIGTGTAGDAINIGTNNTTADTIGIGSSLDTLTLGAGTLDFSNPGPQSNGNTVLCITAGNRVVKGAAQNACNTSSERFKNDITDLTMGLETIDALRPVNYYYDSGTTALQNGLIAEEVYPLIPEAVVLDDQGLPYALDYSQITPVIIKAIQEQSALLGDISPSASSTDNGLSTLISTIQSETAQDPDVVIGQEIASSTEFLVNFISARVTAIRGYFDEIFAKQIYTNQICVAKSDGTEVCLTGDQLQAIMDNSNVSSSLAPTETQTPSSAGDSTQIATTTEASSSDPSDITATSTDDSASSTDSSSVDDQTATSTDDQTVVSDASSTDDQDASSDADMATTSDLSQTDATTTP